MSHGTEEARASHLSGSMKKPIYVPQVMTQNITLMQRDQMREQQRSRLIENQEEEQPELNDFLKVTSPRLNGGSLPPDIHAKRNQLGGNNDKRKGVQFDYGAREASFSPDQSSKLPEISTGANYGLNQKEAI